MKSGRWTLWLRGGACCLFVLCLALARLPALELDEMDLDRLRVLHLYSPLSGLDGARIQEEEQMEEHPVPFALWGQQSGIMALNPALGRSAACDVVTLWGNSQLVFPSPLSLPVQETASCLIDCSTAMSLFGSSRPVGSTVSVGGKDYTLRGIVESSQPVVLIPASSLDKSLTHLSLQVPEGDSPKWAAESFAQRHGLLGEFKEPALPARLGKGLSMLPAAVLLLCAIGQSARAALSYPTGRIRFWVGLALAGALWFLLLWLTDFHFQLPEDMIPNKWSDFDFWGQLLEEKQAELRSSLSRGQTAPELAVLLPVLGAGFWGLLGAVLTPLLPRPKTALEAWIWCAIEAGLICMAAVHLDGGLSRDALLWLALPVGTLGRWAAFFLSSRTEDKKLPAEDKL